tara:strand:+ start:169 stop:447 length:279 start_codon:yes stop_codon:yes gene_type:complete
MEQYTTEQVVKIAGTYGDIRNTLTICEAAESPIPDKYRFKYLVEARDEQLPYLRSLTGDDEEIQGMLKFDTLQNMVEGSIRNFERWKKDEID